MRISNPGKQFYEQTCFTERSPGFLFLRSLLQYKFNTFFYAYKAVCKHIFCTAPMVATVQWQQQKTVRGACLG
jgi:hypothetical protein